MIGLIFYGSIAAFSAWAIVTGLSEPVSYGRITFGLLGAWSVLLWIWGLVWQRLSAKGEGRGLRRFGQFVDILFAIAPGTIVLVYSIFTPQIPSLTNGGMDICDLNVGPCISGTRATIPIGVILMVVGLVSVKMILMEPPKRNDS